MLIDSETYLSMVSRYIHLNPVRTKLMLYISLFAFGFSGLFTDKHNADYTVM